MDLRGLNSGPADDRVRSRFRTRPGTGSQAAARQISAADRASPQRDAFQVPGRRALTSASQRTRWDLSASLSATKYPERLNPQQPNAAQYPSVLLPSAGEAGLAGIGPL